MAAISTVRAAGEGAFVRIGADRLQVFGESTTDAAGIQSAVMLQ